MPALRDRTAPPLTRDQLDGIACVVCGDRRRPMVPLGVVAPSIVRQRIAATPQRRHLEL